MCCGTEVCLGNLYCHCILRRYWKSLGVLSRRSSVVVTSLQAQHSTVLPLSLGAPAWGCCTCCCKICILDKSVTFSRVACDIGGLHPWWQAQTSLFFTGPGAELHAVACRRLCGGRCWCAAAARAKSLPHLHRGHDSGHNHQPWDIAQETVPNSLHTLGVLRASL